MHLSTRPLPEGTPVLPETLVGCSSKSYFSLAQAQQWGPQVLEAVASDPEGATGLFCCPSFPLIPVFLQTLGRGGGLVGSQDVSVYGPGAYTGEVSAELLAEMGCTFVMAGHPERRRYFGEDDDLVARKVAATAAAGLTPTIVVGEAEQSISPAAAVTQQFDAWLSDLPDGADLLVAYEPAWAIGQPQPAPADHVADAVATVRSMIAERTAGARVVYGGSAQPGTYSAVAEAAGSRQDAVPDGLFMARFGVTVDNFLSIVREVREVRARSAH